MLKVSGLEVWGYRIYNVQMMSIKLQSLVLSARFWFSFGVAVHYDVLILFFWNEAISSVPLFTGKRFDFVRAHS